MVGVAASPVSDSAWRLLGTHLSLLSACAGMRVSIEDVELRVESGRLCKECE